MLLLLWSRGSLRDFVVFHVCTYRNTTTACLLVRSVLTPVRDEHVLSLDACLLRPCVTFHSGEQDQIDAVVDALLYFLIFLLEWMWFAVCFLPYIDGHDGNVRGNWVLSKNRNEAEGDIQVSFEFLRVRLLLRGFQSNAERKMNYSRLHFWHRVTCSRGRAKIKNSQYLPSLLFAPLELRYI